MDRQRILLRWGMVLLLLAMALGPLSFSRPYRATASPPLRRQVDVIRDALHHPHLAATGQARGAIQPATPARQMAPATLAAMEPGGAAAALPVTRTRAAQAPHTPPALADQLHAQRTGRLSITATTGKPGSTTTVIGRGYAPDTRIQLAWDEVDVTGRRFLQTESDGTFRYRFTIPASVTNGEHTITALEAGAADALLSSNAPVVNASSASFQVVGGLPPGTNVAALAPPPVPPLPVVEGPARPQATKAWTFAVYIAGDNNLSDYADVNLYQMAATGGTNANVNVVALVDRNNAATQYVQVGDGQLNDVTPDGVRGANIDSGNPQSFVDFMGFVSQYYPAQRYAVVVWNHGGGWLAIETDDRSGNYWDMGELRSALQGGLQHLGVPQYDVLIFDACLMAQYEVALQIDDLVNVQVASAENVPGTGVPYDMFLPALLQNPALSPDAFGAAVVDGYTNFYNQYTLYTLSAVKLEQPFVALQAHINAFAEALLAVGPAQAGAIQTARDAALVYDFQDFVDLGDFAQQVQAHVSDSRVQTTARAVRDALSAGDFVLHETHGPQSAASSGLSIYLPSAVGHASSGRYDEGYDRLDVQGTTWHTFARAFYTGHYPDGGGGTAPEDVPAPPPPPAAASLSDIVYTNQTNTRAFDLYRLYSIADPKEAPPSLPLLSDGYRNSYPRWSPDGQYIVYASDRNSSSHTALDVNLFLIRSTGLQYEKVTAPEPTPTTPSTPTPTPTPTTPTTPTATPTIPPTPTPTTPTTPTIPTTPTTPVKTPTPLPPAQQLLGDPGFEAGADGAWSNQFQAGSAYVSEPVHGGAQAVRLKTHESWVQQWVTVPQGTAALRPSLWYAFESSSDNDPTLYITLYDAAGAKLYEAYIDPQTPQTVEYGTWYEFEASAPHPLPESLQGQRVRFELYLDDATPASGSLVVDDVALVALPDAGAATTDTPPALAERESLLSPDQTTEPRQLTFSNVNCKQGYGTGNPCAVEQSFDPAWLGDGSGILYTSIRLDMANPDPGQWDIRQSIHLLDPTKEPGDPDYDTTILPNPAFTNNGQAIGDDVLFENADMNGSNGLLMFRYTPPDTCHERYDADFCANAIGFIDFSQEPPPLRVLVLNDAEEVATGNYLRVNYPAWRQGTNELAFLYSRVGDPRSMRTLDPRDAPDSGVRENPFETYDIGHLVVDLEAGVFDMQAPIWAFQNPHEGEGVFYRPGWKPGDTPDLTASYSRNGGYTYDVGLFVQDGTRRRGFWITNDGYSYLPSWGNVALKDIPARLQTNVKYLAPAPSQDSAVTLAGSGFKAGERVDVRVGLARAQVDGIITTVKADAAGMLAPVVTLTSGVPPGAYYFQARGRKSAKSSNIDYVVLTPPTGANEGRIPLAGGSVFVNDGTRITASAGTLPVTTTLLYESSATTLAQHPFERGDVLRFFTLDMRRESAQSMPVQPARPLQMRFSYRAADLVLSPYVNKEELTLFGYRSSDSGTSTNQTGDGGGDRGDGWQALQSFGGATSMTARVDVRDYTEFAIADTSRDAGVIETLYLPLVYR